MRKGVYEEYLNLINNGKSSTLDKILEDDTKGEIIVTIKNYRMTDGLSEKFFGMIADKVFQF